MKVRAKLIVVIIYLEFRQGISNMSEIKNRRPIRSRNTRWANWAAKKLQMQGATPNGISLFSIVCALMAMVAFGLAFRTSYHSITVLALLFAIVGMQARLICNLLDGMVAVEGGLRSSVGAIYNELPDRISDVVIFIGIGYGLISFTSASYLGWIAGLLSVMTAYIRLLGGTCGLEQKFLGPMAKQQRIAVLTIGSVIAIFVPAHSQLILYIGLWIVVVGSFLTIINRTTVIAKELTQKGHL